MPLALGLLVSAMPGTASPAMPASLLDAASPSPDPSCSPSPAPSGTASASPDPSCSPDPDPSASADPSPDPSSGSASPGPSSSASASPSPSGSASASPAPSPSASTPPPTATGPAGLIAASELSDITADSAALDGVKFDGVATVRTASGPEQVLEFSMAGLTLSSADLTVTSPGGQTLTVTAATFDFSGNVTLLTTKLSGTLLGAAVTFTPQNPPPAVSGDLTLTNISSSQIFASAGSFAVSGLQISLAG